MVSDEQILAELKKAAAGLYVMSESDYPFEIIRWEETVKLSPQHLRALHGEPEDTLVTVTSLDDFAGFVLSEVSGAGDARPAGLRRHQHLMSILREHLTDVKVYRVGKINIPVYIVGRSASGTWLGVRTRVVET